MRLVHVRMEPGFATRSTRAAFLFPSQKRLMSSRQPVQLFDGRWQPWCARRSLLCIVPYSSCGVVASLHPFVDFQCFISNPFFSGLADSLSISVSCDRPMVLLLAGGIASMLWSLLFSYFRSFQSDRARRADAPADLSVSMITSMLGRSGVLKAWMNRALRVGIEAAMMVQAPSAKPQTTRRNPSSGHRVRRTAHREPGGCVWGIGKD